MSRASAKGGAKRRKNKRGGGGGDHRAISSVMLGSSQATGIGVPGATMAANRPLRGSESVGRAASGGYLETSFNFGETRRTPLSPTVDYCVLCRIERKDSSSLESGIEAARKLGLFVAPVGSSVPYQTLWVCLHCQWTLEKLRTYGGLDQSARGQDVPVQGPLSESPEEAGGRRLPRPSETPRSLEVCKEPREISPETDPESQQLQNYWAEVRYLVRCIYRQAGTTLVPNKEWVKELVDRLCKSDPSQLYQRLDQQARDYLLEMKISLLQRLSASSRASRAPSCLQSPLQAYQFISLLLKEYGAFCQAARTISTFLVTLENKHLNVFQVTWELHNKHLFENLVFSEPLLQSNLPAMVSQIRLGTKMQDTCSKDLYSTLLQQYQHLEEELHSVAKEWLECQKRVSVYIKEKVKMKTKLAKDFKHFKQRQFHEKQLTGRRAGAGENLSDAMRHVLSSPDRRYDSSHSHILISSIMDPPTPSNTQVRQLPHQMGSSAPDRLSESHLPRMSLASLGSGSSSPIPIQQHPRLIHTDNVSTPPFCSDDDVASLSAKFADIYPLDNNNTEVVNKRSDARGDPAGLFLSSSILAVPACYSPHYEGQGSKKGGYDPQQEGRAKSADKDSCSEHSSNTSTSSCACTCTYAGQKEGKYCDYCCEFFRHNWPSAAPRGRNYEGMREKLRFRLAKRKEEQSKKTDQLSEQESVVDHRTVEDLLQFINSSDTKPVSSTRAAKRARHKQKKLEEKTRLEAEAKAQEQEHLREEQRQQEQKQQEEMKERLPEEFQQLQKLQAVKKKEKPRKDFPKLDMPRGNFRAATKYVSVSAHIHSGSLEQTEEPKTSSHSPSRHAAHTGSGARGDSKFVLTKEVSGKQQEPFSFLLDTTHHHKEGTGKQKPKQAWKASSEPRRRPAEFSRASEVQPRPQTQTEPKAKVLDLTSMSEQQRKERKVNRNSNKKQLDQVKSGKASSGPTEPTCPTKQVHHSKLVLADTPQPKGKSKKNRKKKGDGDGDDSSLEDVFMPKDIDLDNVEMDETEREVEYFKRFCLDSTKQTRQRLSIDWSNFSLKKPPFLPTE
ncbi:protein FAM193A-like [Eptesicus fuscus]|uniref:protein FAM193A-like n=1 Tax=Eptesicus fuscus TaxID=29078 RepID=UPI0024045325|nr:protein FAM193A-like [Eptesicus fuscus]